ncbi:hypothetical protein EK21DRAFT_109709 [Setomelanomma holmii]|uniref:Uncharacterized protein n=1 Tax=Setomelanomma holmii TaxID=210430 RepID=A0A9P4HEL7_9PLEO|nr:hypothetical protein EK21DRAFT_109709 [Setomelanomma holmii]
MSSPSTPTSHTFPICPDGLTSLASPGKYQQNTFAAPNNSPNTLTLDTDLGLSNGIISSSNTIAGTTVSGKASAASTYGPSSASLPDFSAEPTSSAALAITVENKYREATVAYPAYCKGLQSAERTAACDETVHALRPIWWSPRESRSSENFLPGYPK